MELNNIEEFKTSAALREQLTSMGITREFNEGDVILQEHGYIRAIPIVLNGSIRVMRNDDDGREILLYYIRPGESCIMSFLGGIHQDTSKVTAVAEEPTEILLIPIDRLPQLIREHPQWLEYIFRLYHKRFEELLEVVNSVAFKKMDERLSDFIHKKVEMTGDKTVHITHEQIAAELGTARTVVSRLLKQMEHEGTVKLGRNKISLM